MIGGGGWAGRGGGSMAGTLRDDLASLSIERERRGQGKGGRPAGKGRGDGPIRLLSLAIWLIQLGVLEVAVVFAVREYDQIRAEPEVKVALVQEMTSGEAEKLRTAKS